MRCELMSGGTVLEAESIPLEANGQSSWFIDAAFPDTDTSGFVGSVRCDAVGTGDWRQLEFQRIASTKNRTEARNLPH